MLSTTEERLAMCDLVRTRFAGRAALERAASRGGVALVRLEARLGLASEADVVAAERESALTELGTMSRWYPIAAELAGIADHVARETTAARRYARDGAQDCNVARIARIAAPRQCAAIDRLRAKRAARKPPAPPTAGRIASMLSRKIIASASFREATHDHTTLVVVVEPGRERATSEAGKSWAVRNETASYKYPNATSEHAWHVSEALFSREVRELNAAAPCGVLYLAVDVRVRQGRGTMLVTERRSGSRGGWAVVS